MNNIDWKQNSKRNLLLLAKAGMPLTIIGMVVVFLGIYIVKYFLAGTQYFSIALIGWLAVFWFVYQPFFIRKIRKVDAELRNSHNHE
jgi:hypothetical protein